MPQVIISKKLKNKAMHYLSRYASTEKKLTQILLKFAGKKLPEITIDEAQNYIKETIDWCRKNGYVNDYDYIVVKIRNGRSKGHSTRQIAQKLFHAGLSKSLVSKALKGDENSFEKEFEAALIAAKKKANRSILPLPHYRPSRKNSSDGTISKSRFQLRNLQKCI